MEIMTKDYQTISRFYKLAFKGHNIFQFKDL